MPLTHVTIKTTRDFDFRADQIIAHWTSAEARARWEVAPDTDMVYDGFDCRPGGREIVRIVRGGKELGQLHQHIHVVEATRMVGSTQGVFGGQVTLLMQIALEAVPTERGCALNVVAQVMDMTGNDDLEREHKTGWSWVLGRFASDLAAHGPIKP